MYSNRAQGETVRFQIWDDSACKLYNATEESHPFVANASIGVPDAPVTLTATEVAGSGALTVACNAGWTWISTNVSSADMSVNAILADLTPLDGDLIKSQTAFSQAAFLFNDSTGTGWNWEGSLIDLDNVSSYMVRLSSSGTIFHAGAPVPITTPVPVTQGWNWIGYLPEGPQEPSDALTNLDVAVNGDIIKSQTAFAQYVNGYWYGALDSLRTGQGYKLYLSSPTATDSSFTYTPYVPSLSPPVVLAGAGTQASASADSPARPVPGSTPAWSVNPFDYQFNMTLTAVLLVDGRESIDEHDLVGAFVGDECRGVASLSSWAASIATWRS